MDHLAVKLCGERHGVWLLGRLTQRFSGWLSVHMRITPSVNNYCTTSHYLPQVGIHTSEGINLLYSPLPGKIIRQSLSTSADSLGGSDSKASAYNVGNPGSILGWED